MKVNPLIRQMFKEISQASIVAANHPLTDRKEMKRLMRIFTYKLNEEERLFLFCYVMTNMHYKNLLLDDDNLMKINNIKLRTVTFIFLLTTIFIIALMVIYNKSELINGYGNSLVNMLGFMFSLE